MTKDLFAFNGEQLIKNNAPLADRLRPKTLDEFVGQDHILAQGRLLRLSGTGTLGATLRVYFESFVPSDGDIAQDPQLVLAPLIKSIDSLAEISKRTGMSAPTVIT